MKAASHPALLQGSYFYLALSLQLILGFRLEIRTFARNLQLIVNMFRAQQNAFDDAVGELHAQEALGSH